MPHLVIPEDGDLQYELQASATSAVTALVSLLIRGKVRRPLEHVFTHVAGDRTIETFVRDIPEGGEVVGLNVTSPESRGEVYLSVYIRQRGRRMRRIARGPVYTGGDLELGQNESSLDGPGRIITNEGTATLVNNVTLTRTITVPANARWRLLYAAVENADNVDRGIDYVWDDGTNLLGGWSSPDTRITIVAGQEIVLPMSVGASFQTGNPSSILLSELFRITIVWFAGGASAGGATRSSAVVEQWIHQGD